MKVLYDHQVFGWQGHGGISRYFCEIMKRFRSRGAPDFEIPVARSANPYLRAAGLGKRTGFWSRLVPEGAGAGESRALTALKEGKFDIFHPTYYEPYFLEALGRKPFVLTVYDMIHELFAEEFPRYRNGLDAKKKEVASRAARIIAISENTKKDLVRIWGIPEGKVAVVHLASAVDAASAAAPRRRPSSRYLLYVGSRKGHKNFRRFLLAVEPLLKDDRELAVVSAGEADWSPEERALLRERGLEGQVTRLEPTDRELAWLYRNALAFVFPSLYEGFGIPVLEAFACGCPVAASRAGSLPEIAGDAALYFDPRDEASILAAVKDLISDAGIRAGLREKGFRRSADFSWERTADETRAVYEALS